MKTWNFAVKCAALALLLAGPLAAQDVKQPVAPKGVAPVEDVESRMIDAERRMAEAAREMAELTSERLPQMRRFERHIETLGRPRLGVAIGPGKESGPVEGVNINAVTPGTAASDAGLRAGDIIRTSKTSRHD